MANAKSTAFAVHAPIIGRVLYRLAVEISRGEPVTKKTLAERIRSLGSRKRTIHGSKSQRTALEAVEAAIHDIREIREARRPRRSARQQLIHSASPRHPDLAGLRPGRLPPQAPLVERLHTRTSAQALDCLKAHYRINGEGTERVVLTRDPSAVGVEQDESKDWSYYRGQYKGWAKRRTHTVLTLPQDWLVRVAKVGLTAPGGLLTLDAQRLEGAPEGVALYAAVWLEQSRGYRLRAIRGYLGVHTETGVAYHAETPQAAIKGCLGKRDVARLDDLLAHHDLPALIEAAPSITVRLEDARATGACEYGIRSWCHATGLDYEAGQASLETVYAAYQRQPLPEARAAILHALRRNRAAVRRIVRAVAPAETEAA